MLLLFFGLELCFDIIINFDGSTIFFKYFNYRNMSKRNFDLWQNFNLKLSILTTDNGIEYW